ncbi:MAG TPA: dihydrodipicolinate reductase C-terminal domain-containing protein [Candidatus Elarobacter sp.]|nr:dihydrodipicolinate reductase C-terminal domain-containing protein [Candidatus Elarobacter sp.]
MTQLRIAIIGPGRMGQAVAELARQRGDVVVATIDAQHPVTRESLAGADVAIEFTEPAAAAANVLACVDAGCPCVVGTTGWYHALPRVSDAVAALQGALLWSPNFSLGVQALLQIARRAGELSARLAGFDAHILEIHHAAKKDAPSGTAVMLRDAFVHGTPRDVPITSVRVGAVPGTHQLMLDGAFEQIVLSHEVRDRRVFADGALVAAHWLVGRQGVFTLADVVAASENES